MAIPPPAPLSKSRRLAASFVAILGTFTVGTFLYNRMPQEVVVEYNVADGVESAGELSLDFTDNQGELWKAVRIEVRKPGPSFFTLKLPKGAYTVRGTLFIDAETRTSTASFSVPTKGNVELMFPAIQ